MKDFKELKVWQKAHALTLKLYCLTIIFPREEQYGLTSQIRRRSASIAANIAEGCGRRGTQSSTDFCRLRLVRRANWIYHLLLARDLHLLHEPEYRESAGLLLEVRRMLTSLSRKVDLKRSLAKC